MLIDTKSHVDPQNDAVELIFDLTGNDPFQHEFLKEVFAADLQDSADEKAGKDDALPHAKFLGEEDLRVRISTKTPGAFARATRTVENRRRAELHLPSVEEEEASVAAKAKADEEAKANAESLEKLDATARAAGFKDHAEQIAHEEEVKKQESLGEAFGRGMAKAASASAPPSAPPAAPPK